MRAPASRGITGGSSDISIRRGVFVGKFVGVVHRGSRALGRGGGGCPFSTSLLVCVGACTLTGRMYVRLVGWTWTVSGLSRCCVVVLVCPWLVVCVRVVVGKIEGLSSLAQILHSLLECSIGFFYLLLSGGRGVLLERGGRIIQYFIVFHGKFAYVWDRERRTH